MKQLLITIAAVFLTTTAFANPIHDAAQQGNLAGVQAELDKGVDVDLKNDNGWTPLHYAAYGGKKEIVELLIAKNANVNAKVDGRTPLHYAALKGHKEIAELLIAKGADVNAKIEKMGDEVGLTSTEIFLVLTPLDWAIEDNHTEIAALLRKHGAKTGEELKVEEK